MDQHITIILFFAKLTFQATHKSKKKLEKIFVVLSVFHFVDVDIISFFFLDISRDFCNRDKY